MLRINKVIPVSQAASLEAKGMIYVQDIKEDWASVGNTYGVGSKSINLLKEAVLLQTQLLAADAILEASAKYLNGCDDLEVALWAVGCREMPDSETCPKEFDRWVADLRGLA